MRKLMFALLFCSLILAQSGKLNITFDPRVELLGIVEILAQHESSADKIFSADNQYLQSVENSFSKFKNHPAVDELKKLHLNGMNTDLLVKFMLHLSAPPKLELKYPLNDLFTGIPEDEAGEKKNMLISWLNNVRDFSEKSGFIKFYDQKSEFYQEIGMPLIKTLEAMDIIPPLEKFFGISKNEYNLILTPLFMGGYTAEIEEDKCFLIIGPTRNEDNLPHFCLHRTPPYVRQQFAYFFIQPMVDNHWEAFSKSSTLFHPIDDIMRKQGIPDWKNCVYWHLIYAAVNTAKENGLQRELDIISNVKFGFIYLLEIMDLIEISYLTNRDKYDTFANFLPTIARHLEDISNIPSDDFSDRISARVTATTSDLWKSAEENCKKLSYSDITLLLSLDIQSYPKQAENVFRCFMGTHSRDDEHYWMTQYQLGKVKYFQGELDSAEQIFNQYLKYQPQGEMASGAFWRLGQIKQQKGNYNEAKQLYEHALRIDPNLLQAKNSLNELLEIMEKE